MESCNSFLLLPGPGWRHRPRLFMEMKGPGGYWQWFGMEYPDTQEQVATGNSVSSSFPSQLILQHSSVEFIAKCLLASAYILSLVLKTSWLFYEIFFQCISFLLQLNAVSFPYFQLRTLISTRTEPTAYVIVTQTYDCPGLGSCDTCW